MDSLVENEVNLILEEKDDKFRTTEVHKDIDCEVDLGNLLVSDPNPTNYPVNRSDTYLLNLARENCQICINELFKLPAENVDNVVIVRLPRPTMRIPREKRVPAAKQKTKWEKFAAMKGIVNKKKGRMVYDEQSKEYKPRWGYNRANDDTKEWLIPVPEHAGADPNEDQFAKRAEAKKERIAKNEVQRLRNLARNKKGKVPTIGLLPTASASDKDHVDRALMAAKTSNASMGMFTDTLPKEKKLKTGNVGKKRKFQPNFPEGGTEKKRALEILSRLGETSIVDKQKAAKIVKHQSDPERGRGRGKKFSKGGSRGDDSFGGDQSFSSKSPRTPGKKMSGHKGKGKGPGGKGKSPGGRKSPGGKGKSPGGKGRK